MLREKSSSRPWGASPRPLPPPRPDGRTMLARDFESLVGDRLLLFLFRCCPEGGRRSLHDHVRTGAANSERVQLHRDMPGKESDHERATTQAFLHSLFALRHSLFSPRTYLARTMGSPHSVHTPATAPRRS